MIIIDKKACVQCGLCIAVCPFHVLSMGEDGPVVDMNRECITCMHCAAACPQQAVHLEGADRAQEYPAPSTDPVERLIQTRRSIRHFKQEPPPKALIQEVLDLAQWVPSGHNYHYHGWTILWGKEITDGIVRMAFDWAKEGNDPQLVEMAEQGANLITFGAPCLIYCHSPEDYNNSVVDPAIATATVELLLVNRGLSVCWGAALLRLSNQIPAIYETLEIPKGSKMRCALMVGYADGEHYPNIPFRPKAEPTWQE